MRCIVKPVGQPPEVCNIPNTLEAMQSLVGGYIQLVPIGLGIDLLCNEEGLLLKLPVNCGFAGTIALVGLNLNTAERRSLADDEVGKALAWFRLHEQDRLPDTESDLVMFDSLAKMLDYTSRKAAAQNREWDDL